MATPWLAVPPSASGRLTTPATSSPSFRLPVPSPSYDLAIAAEGLTTHFSANHPIPADPAAAEKIIIMDPPSGSVAEFVWSVLKPEGTQVVIECNGIRVPFDLIPNRIFSNGVMTIVAIDMPPGHYRLCHTTVFNAIAALGGEPIPEENCESAILAPGGRIRLELPTAERESKEGVSTSLW